MSTASTFQVTGMTCGHCVTAVSEEIGKIPSVRDVAIDLVAGGTSVVHVVSDAPLDAAAVREAVDEAGYQLVGEAS